MQQVKHTPGPWYVQPEQDGAFTIWANELQLGEVTPDDMGDKLPAQANAALIAAAPDMLAALEWWQAQMRDDSCDDMGKLLDDMSAKARAAIAKAKGE